MSMNYRERQRLEKEALRVGLERGLARALGQNRHEHVPKWDTEYARFRCEGCGKPMLARELSAV